MKRRNIIFTISILGLQIFNTSASAQSAAKLTAEPYRPLIHFSPKAHWMNDPNGMVFYKGVYHLFFQYYPDSTVWGPCIGAMRPARI